MVARIDGSDGAPISIWKFSAHRGKNSFRIPRVQGWASVDLPVEHLTTFEPAVTGGGTELSSDQQDLARGFSRSSRCSRQLSGPREEDDMLHIIWFVIVGFVVGLIGRAVVPGADHMGFIATTVVGIIGSVIGGLIGRVISKPAPDAKFHPAGFFMSIVGAIVL